MSPLKGLEALRGLPPLTCLAEAVTPSACAASTAAPTLILGLWALPQLQAHKA